MKLKSIVLIFTVLVIGISFVAYSTNAQKSKESKEIKNEVQADENLMSELRKNVVCTMLYENILAKETDQWTIKQANCAESSAYASLSIQKDKEKLIILIQDVKTPEEAKIVVGLSHGQPISPNKDYGDEGHRISIGGKIKSIDFIKGRIYTHIFCDPCNSDETPKRFAEYVLKAIEGQ